MSTQTLHRPRGHGGATPPLPPAHVSSGECRPSGVLEEYREQSRLHALDDRDLTAGYSLGAVRILEPNTSSTYAPMHPSATEPWARNAGELSEFAGIDADQAMAVLHAVPRPELESDRSTEGHPSTLELLELVSRHPGRVEAGGVLYSPAREDEGVEVHTLWVFGAPIDIAPLPLLAELGLSRAGRGLKAPDVVETVEVPWRPTEPAAYLRWV